jgi:hypothetical protein
VSPAQLRCRLDLPQKLLQHSRTRPTTSCLYNQQSASTRWKLPRYRGPEENKHVVSFSIFATISVLLGKTSLRPMQVLVPGCIRRPSIFRDLHLKQTPSRGPERATIVAPPRNKIIGSDNPRPYSQKLNSVCKSTIERWTCWFGGLLVWRLGFVPHRLTRCQFGMIHSAAALCLQVELTEK